MNAGSTLPVTFVVEKGVGARAGAAGGTITLANGVRLTFPAGALPNDVFITGVGKFLPGEPIPNDRMEDYLGRIHGKPSRARRHLTCCSGTGTLATIALTEARIASSTAQPVPEYADCNTAKPARSIGSNIGDARCFPLNVTGAVA